jgi:Tfp pilus assembly protein PilE
MQLNQNAKFQEMHTTQEANMQKMQSDQENKMQELFQKFQASLNLAVSQLVDSVTNTATPQSPGTGSTSISSITNQVENSSVVGAQN